MNIILILIRPYCYCFFSHYISGYIGQCMDFNLFNNYCMFVFVFYFTDEKRKITGIK
jgi:hypothetical protein